VLRLTPSSTRRILISTALALLAVVVLVLANAFFVAVEFALVAVRRTRMQQLAAEGNRRAEQVLDRLNHLDTYIASTQLGITMASLGLGWVGEPALASLIEPVVAHLPFVADGSREVVTHTVAFIVTFSVITSLHIVVGEQVPKNMAIRRPEAMALFTAGPIHAFFVVFRPVIAALNRASDAILRLLGFAPTAGHTLVQSAEELKLSIDASREAGLVHETAHDIVDRAFTFTDMEARHVMVPRTEVTAIPVTAALEEIFELSAATGHVRLPVYEGDSDHIVGIVNVKRLLPVLYAECAERMAAGTTPVAPRFDVRSVMVDPLVIPETVPAADILNRLREAHTQIAVVIDEYGGTAGILTLEDLVESLVGDIQDELDPFATDSTVSADGSFMIDGLTTLVEAKDLHDLDLSAEEFAVETVGGFVFSSLGRPAQVGDEVAAPDGRMLRVEDLDGLRVARIRILLANSPSTDTSSVLHASAAREGEPVESRSGSGSYEP
jgi:putative hemolysin